MSKNFLIIIMLFSLFGIVNAITFTDDFSTYNNQYLVLNDMNVLSDWISAYDGNAPILDQNTMVRNGGLYIACDVSLNASNACGTQLTGQQKHFDLSDWNNTNSRMYVPLRIDDNSTVSNIEVYLGTNFSNSFLYRNTNPYLAGFYQGWLVVPFDLNTTISKAGTPNIADINYVLIRLVYSAGQTDFNMELGGLWVSRQPNEFNDVWRTLDIPGGGINAPQGYAVPFNYSNQGYGMSMRNNDKTSLGFHGRVFISQFNSLDLSKYNIDFSMDLNQVDINQQSRIILSAQNFGGTDNFDGCYLLRSTSTTAMLGVEEWNNGVKSFTQASINHNLNDYNTIRCTIIDHNISVYIDGVIKASRTLNDRIDGYIGTEAYVGRQNIKNVSLTMELTPTISLSGQTLLARPEWNAIQSIFLPLLLIIVMLGMIYGGIKNGSPSTAIIGVIMIFIIYTVINALFFS